VEALSDLFPSPFLGLVNALRLLCLVGGGVLALGAGYRLLDDRMSPAHRLTLLALAILAATSAANAGQRLGNEHVTYHVWLVTVAVVVGLVATFTLRPRGER
jgi:peptidoglycan/LPS O-acetylase OafA/YrhL